MASGAQGEERVGFNGFAWGAIIPAAARLASAPGSPRSKTNTRSLACARRSAIEEPIKPHR